MRDALDTLAIQYLNSPEKTAEDFNKKQEMRAVLFIGYKPVMWHSDFLNGISRSYMYNALLAKHLHDKALSLLRYPLGLQALFTTRIQALEATLELNKIIQKNPTPIPATMVLGWSHGIELDEWYGMAILQCRHLVELGVQQEMLVTQEYAKDFSVPPGIGLAQARRSRIQLAGFPFWTLKDYRPVNHTLACCPTRTPSTS